MPVMEEEEDEEEEEEEGRGTDGRGASTADRTISNHAVQMQANVQLRSLLLWTRHVTRWTPAPTWGA